MHTCIKKKVGDQYYTICNFLFYFLIIIYHAHVHPAASGCYKNGSLAIRGEAEESGNGTVKNLRIACASSRVGSPCT